MVGERTYAKRQIEDKHVGIEVFFVPTVVSGWKIGCGRTPEVRVDDPEVVSNTERDEQRSSRPEPNLDAVLLASGEGIESASARIEIQTVGTCAANLGTTTLIVVVVGITVCRDGCSARTSVSYSAVGWKEVVLAQFDICAPAWCIREGCATKSSSVRLRERPVV